MSELSILGSIMLKPDNMLFADCLDRDDFSDWRAGAVFGCIKMLHTHNMAIDSIHIRNALDRSGELGKIGGEAYLTDLIACVPASGNIESHVKVVADAARARRVASAMMEGAGRIQSGADVDVEISTVTTAAENKSISNVETMTDVMSKTFTDIEAAQDGRQQAGFIETGFIDLDAKITGFIRGDFTIIGGRPSQGKSAFAIGAALNIANKGFAVHIVSLDSPSAAVGRRILANRSRVSLADIRNGKIMVGDLARIGSAMEAAQSLRITVDTTSRMLADIRMGAMKIQRKTGLDVLIVDYIQQVSTGKESRYDDVTGVSAGLKSLAGELDIAVVGVSQLNRNAEGRRPCVADLRESGQIEQDAYLILFPYRPEVNENEGAICSCTVCAQRGLHVGEHAEMIIAKQKEGVANCVVPISWHAETATFGNLAYEGMIK